MRSQIFRFKQLFLFSLAHSSTLRGRSLTRKLPVFSPVLYSLRCKTMPKKEKTSKSSLKATETPSGPVTKLKDGMIGIAIHAKPGAKQNAVTDVSEETVGVAIAAPPADGEANAELVRYLSKVLQLKKSEITLDKGSKSREKVVKVTAAVSVEEILNKLRTEASS